jgi:long-chain fatty acid transport protein
MKKIVLISLVTSSMLLAGGYKIPEQSTNAVALGAANVAHNQNNADAAYYNPAKMVFMSDENHIEADLNYIGLEKVKYKPTSGNEIKSENETFYVPTLHFVSSKLGDNGARIGVSVVVPGGLSKRWNDAPASTSAKEFTLKTVEINPTAAFKINDKIGLAVGFRALYSDGIVSNAYYDMTGTGLDFGYNLALQYKPTQALEIGATYRSKITMNVDGSTSRVVAGTNGDVNVALPLPAALNIAAAYTFATKTTLEAVYERTYWSAYSNLDFNFSDATSESVLGGSHPKNWKDTNTFRFGLTQVLDKATLMAGLVIDDSPTPEATVGFELPDTKTVAVSLGGRYKINDKIDVALSGLYSMHKDRTVHNSSLDGEFTGGNVLILSAGLGYKF